MRARAIALFALLLLLVLPLPAQNAYPTKGQVRAILKEAKSVLAQFEKVTDRIDFARWDAPHGLISQRKAELKLIRGGVITAARRWSRAIHRVHTSGFCQESRKNVLRHGS
jgi:hypothetical protein